MNLDDKQYAELRQAAESREQAREKMEQVQEIDAAIKSKMEGVKHLKAQRTALMEEVTALLTNTTPAPARTEQLRMPFGVADMPLSALKLKKSVLTMLATSGIERVPQLVAIVSGKDSDYPNGLLSVDGIKEPTAKGIQKSLQDYLDQKPESQVPEPNAEKSKPKLHIAPVDGRQRVRVIKPVDGQEVGTELEGSVQDDGSFLADDAVLMQDEFELVG